MDSGELTCCVPGLMEVVNARKDYCWECYLGNIPGEPVGAGQADGRAGPVGPLSEPRARSAGIHRWAGCSS